jgi:hypothetical protein
MVIKNKVKRIAKIDGHLVNGFTNYVYAFLGRADIDRDKIKPWYNKRRW